MEIPILDNDKYTELRSVHHSVVWYENTHTHTNRNLRQPTTVKGSCRLDLLSLWWTFGDLSVLTLVTDSTFVYKAANHSHVTPKMLVYITCPGVVSPDLTSHVELLLWRAMKACARGLVRQDSSGCRGDVWSSKSNYKCTHVHMSHVLVVVVVVLI